jgi:hypothetical protein
LGEETELARPARWCGYKALHLTPAAYRLPRTCGTLAAGAGELRAARGAAAREVDLAPETVTGRQAVDLRVLFPDAFSD